MTDPEKTAKHDIRRSIRQRLADLDPDTRSTAAVAVRAEMRRIVESVGPRTVMAYLADDLELDLDPTIADLLETGVTVAVPSVRADRGRMHAVRLPGLDPAMLERDRYGLRRPTPPEVPVPEAAIDLVLVPGVAFTTDGRRLGRGGGYYDRWLSTLPEPVITIGVAFACQVLDTLPSEDHDVPLDRLILA